MNMGLPPYAVFQTVVSEGLHAKRCEIGKMLQKAY